MNDSCTHCSQLVETTDYLLLHCTLAREARWQILGVQVPMAETPLIDWWLDLRRRVATEFRKGVDSLVLLTCWRLWLSRNDIIFNDRCISSDSLVALIRDDIGRWYEARAKHLVTNMARLCSFGSIT